MRDFIRLPPDSTGKRLDAYSYDVDGSTRYAQALVLVDTAGTVLSSDAANGLDVDVTRVQGVVDVAQSGDWTVGIDTPVGGLPVDIQDASIAVTGPLAVTQSGAWSVTADTELPAAAALADAAANPNVPTAGAALSFYNGATWDRVRGTIANGLLVDVSRVQGTVAVTRSGAWGVDASQAGDWTVSIDTPVGGLPVDIQDASIAVTVGEVEVKNDSGSPLAVSGTVTADTELPAAVAMSDALANPTAPGVAAYGAVYNATAWERARTPVAADVSVVGIAAHAPMLFSSSTFSYQVSAAGAGDTNSGARVAAVGNWLYNGSSWDRMRGDTANGLDVDVTRVQGTVAVTQSGGWSVTADTELAAAAALADAAANPTVPTVGAALSFYNGSTWDRARGDTANGLDVDVTRVSGTVTVDSELPAAAALADAAANPTAPIAGSAGLLYNGSTWDRTRAVVSGAGGVAATGLQGIVPLHWSTGSTDYRPDVSAGSLADGDTGYALPRGIYIYNGSTWDRARGDTTNGLDVDVTRVSGTVTVDTELPAAAALADATANPTVPAAGSLGLVYNGATWDRMRATVAATVTSLAATGLLAMAPQVQFATNDYRAVQAAGLVTDGAGGSGVPSAGGYIYNGSTWDRVRSIGAVAGTSGTGLQGMGLLVSDGTNYRQPMVASGLGDAHNGVNSIVVANYFYNGSTWDRMRGDTTNGIDVDVTRVSGTVTVDSELPAAAALADATSNPTVPAVGANLSVYNGSTWDRLRTASGDGMSATGLLAIAQVVYDGSNWNRVRAATSDSLSGTLAAASGTMLFGGSFLQRARSAEAAADANAGTGAFWAGNSLWNGATWDRQRGNVDGTALASSARTGTTSSADLTAHNATGVAVFWDVTVLGASPSLTMSLEMKDPVTGKYKAYFTGVAVTATGSYVYGAFPGNSAAGAQAGASTLGVPRTFRITITHNNANSMTYSVGYSLLI